MLKRLLACIGVACAMSASAQTTTPAGMEDTQVALLTGNSNLILMINQDAGTFRIVALGEEPDRPTSRFEQQAVASLPGGSGEVLGRIRADSVVDQSLPEVPELPSDRIRVAMKRVSGGRETILLVQNRYAAPIHFRISATDPDGKTLPADQQTICPVAAGGKSVEHWRLPVRTLSLYNFEFVNTANARRGCW